MVDNHVPHIEPGRSYKIEELIEELKGYDDIRIGHAVIAGGHFYYIGRIELESILEKIIKKEKEIHAKISRDVVILSIIDPFEKFEKYSKFYNGIEKDIMTGIEKSRNGSIAATKSSFIEEGNKFGFDLTEKKQFKDFMSGLRIFFARVGISAEVTNNDYIIFKIRRIA